MADYGYLSVSDGTGDASLMHIQSNRSPGATTLSVDSVIGVPTKFIATYGSLLSTGFIDPTTKGDFKGHLGTGNQLVIDGFEPGTTDVGNTTTQIIVIKPNTPWSNLVASHIENMTGNGTPENVTVNNLTVGGNITVAGGGLTPTGGMMEFAGSSAPSGWLIANGTAVSRATYAALFTAIGTTFGAGDGSTTFNLPDRRGNVGVGYLASDTNFGTLGGTGGETTHHLVQSELPYYQLGVSDPGHGHGHSWSGFAQPVGTSGGGSQRAGSTSGQQTADGDINIFGSGTGIGVYSNGSDVPHNNLQPYLTINYIIKT